MSAVFKVFIHCGMKTLYCLSNRFPVKSDDVARIYDPAHKNTVIEIRFNPRDISLIDTNLKVDPSLIPMLYYRLL